MTDRSAQLVVMGTSSGGLAALTQLLGRISSDYSTPIAIVQHIQEGAGNFLSTHLESKCSRRVREAEDKECINASTVYLAPSSYHLMVEANHTFSLSDDPRVNYSRPSIDVLFETAADAYASNLVGILLTGANSDGARGLKKIKDLGGLTIIQDPTTCHNPEMTSAALRLFQPDYILNLEQIAGFLNLGCRAISGE